MLRAMKSVNMKGDEPPSFFMVVGMLLYSFVLQLKLISIQSIVVLMMR